MDIVRALVLCGFYFFIMLATVLTSDKKPLKEPGVYFGFRFEE